jgi:ribosome assembly protein 4
MASHTALKRKLKQVALRPEQNIPKKKKKVEPKPEISDTKYFIQFKSAEGEKTGTLCEISSDFTTKQLNELLNAFLPNEEKNPYYFYVNGMEITTNVRDTLIEMHKLRGEEVKSYEEETLEITYFPQALFLVRPVTRCTASLPGHSEAILNVQFSPDGTKLASGSGDATVRIWDNNSEMPMHTLKGHTNWVFCVAWSPDAKKIASGGRDGIIKVWWGESGQKNW